MNDWKKITKGSHKKNEVIQKQYGGANYNNNQNAIMDVKIPKALYYLFSDKITNFNLLSHYKRAKIMTPIKNFVSLKKYISNIQDEEYRNIIEQLNYEKLTELMSKYPDEDRELLIRHSLKENLNSSALFRINNSLLNIWGKTSGGKLINFNKTKNPPYEKIKKNDKRSMSKFKFIESILNEIIIKIRNKSNHDENNEDNEDNENNENNINIDNTIKIFNNVEKNIKNKNNAIRELYFFDLPLETFPVRRDERLEFDNFINKEIAKCLLHTIMYPFSIDYMIEQPIYYRFLNEKYTGDQYDPRNGFNYKYFTDIIMYTPPDELPDGLPELPTQEEFRESGLKIFLDFYNLINDIATQDHTDIDPEMFKEDLAQYYIDMGIYSQPSQPSQPY